MSNIQINSSHKGNLSLDDIQNIKSNAEQGDTVKFGCKWGLGKEYTVNRDNNGQISLNQKENRSFFNGFWTNKDGGRNSDLAMNRMNQQLHAKVSYDNVKVGVFTWNQANQQMQGDVKDFFQNLINTSDYDVVLFAEQESKGLAKQLDIQGMNLLSHNGMKVMTKGIKEGISQTSLTVFAKEGLDINVHNESSYRHGMNKGGVKTSLEINGENLTAISAHLDSNKASKRAHETNKLMQGITPDTEVAFTGDLNERNKTRLNPANQTPEFYDPITENETHLSEHNLNFQALDKPTYAQLDGEGQIKHKKGRARADVGQLDNTGITNNNNLLQNHQSNVIDIGFNNISDHKPVQSIFEIRGLKELEGKIADGMELSAKEQGVAADVFDIVANAMERPFAAFENKAGFLNANFNRDVNGNIQANSNIREATLNDVTPANLNRLSLHLFDDTQQNTLTGNFFSEYINVKDAVFQKLFEEYQGEFAQLNQPDSGASMNDFQALTEYIEIKRNVASKIVKDVFEQYMNDPTTWRN